MCVAKFAEITFITGVYNQLHAKNILGRKNIYDVTKPEVTMKNPLNL